MRTHTVRAKVNHETKIRAEHILNRLGLTMSEAINLMLVQVNLREALPFNIAIYPTPNAETLQAMQEAKNNGEINIYDDPTQLFNKLGIDINAKNHNDK